MQPRTVAMSRLWAGRLQIQILSPRLRVKVQRAHTARSVG